MKPRCSFPLSGFREFGMARYGVAWHGHLFPPHPLRKVATIQCPDHTIAHGLSPGSISWRFRRLPSCLRLTPVSLTLSAFTRLGSYEDRTTVARHASLTATRNHVRVSYRDILAFLAIARAADRPFFKGHSGTLAGSGKAVRPRGDLGFANLQY